MMEVCERCGEEFKWLSTHHLIPRWCGGESATMEVCNRCHVELDRLFTNFIKWGNFHPEPWRNPEKRKIYSQTYSEQYYREHKEEINRRRRENYLKNRDEELEKAKQYYQKHRRRILARIKRNYKKKKHADMTNTEPLEVFIKRGLREKE